VVPSVPPRGLVLVRLSRVGHRAVGDERDDRVDLRIRSLDARQMRRHHLARRQLLAANPCRELHGRHLAELVGRVVREHDARSSPDAPWVPVAAFGSMPLSAAAPSRRPKSRRETASRGSSLIANLL
jgi:hypothetical protein